MARYARDPGGRRHDSGAGTPAPAAPVPHCGPACDNHEPCRLPTWRRHAAATRPSPGTTSIPCGSCSTPRSMARGRPHRQGTCQNREQALRFMTRPERPRPVGELVDVIDAGDRVVVILRAPGPDPERRPLQANVTTFRDGKVVEMVHHDDPQDALAAAGLPERGFDYSRLAPSLHRALGCGARCRPPSPREDAGRDRRRRARGLTLALLLAREGIESVVLESRTPRLRRAARARRPARAEHRRPAARRSASASGWRARGSRTTASTCAARVARARRDHRADRTARSRSTASRRWSRI